MSWRCRATTSSTAASFSDWTDASVAEFLLWHAENPNAVASCVAHARENARSVREQISSEMWEHLNRLYFYLTQDVDRASVMRGPYDLFQRVRDGSQAFQGITAATMNHGEGYEFIQLGRYLERAAMTVRVLGVRHAEAQPLPGGDCRRLAAPDGTPQVGERVRGLPQEPRARSCRRRRSSSSC